MEEIEFMNSMREQFGEFAFRATTDKVQVTSTNWPVNPKHPANQPEDKFIKPIFINKPLEGRLK